jgi:GTPase SAR1 family protein
MVLYEDDETNRILESMDIFDSIVNSEVFKTKPIVLLLNKIDLFKEKIKSFPLKNTFSDYEGEDDYGKAVEFIENKFISLNKFDKNRIRIFKFSALETKEVEDIMTNVILDNFQ